MKLKNEDIKCNWEIDNTGNESTATLSQYIVLFLDDNDDLSTPNKPIILKKGTDETIGSCTIKIKLSNTNLINIQSIYIESQSRVQEFLINESQDYIATQKSYLKDEKGSSAPAMYATEYIPEDNIPNTSILAIKFLSLINKNSAIISKIIIDCKLAGPLELQTQEIAQPQLPQIPQQINNIKGGDINSLMSMMSMLNLPALTGKPSPLPTQLPPQFQPQQQIKIPNLQTPNPQQSAIITSPFQQLQKEIESNIKKSIIESENRIIELMEKKFDSLFKRIDNLEKKLEINNKENSDIKN